MVPNDLKHAFRMLARNPGYTLAAVAALALGIGANTAIFSVINTVLLKPLTYPDPDRIVQLMNTSPNGTYAWASIPNFSNWRDQTSVLEDVAAFDQGGSAMNITGAYPEQLRAASVTADYFRLFGARFVYGRGFTPDEDRPHAARNIVLSYALWQRRFAADPGIVGKTVDLSGEPYVIIGVTAPDYRTDPVVDAWVAFRFDMNSTDQGHYFFVAGRLKPGVTLERANAQLKLAFDEFRRKYPLVNSKWSFGAKRLQDQVVGDARISLMVLAGAVSFVLLIAGARRRQEAGDRASHSARCGTRARRPATADGERSSFSRGRPGGIGARRDRRACAAGAESRRYSADRRERVSRVVGLAGLRIHSLYFARHRHRLRIDPRSGRLSRGPEFRLEGIGQPVRNRGSTQHHPIGSGDR
jgi:hypothetical protein